MQKSYVYDGSSTNNDRHFADRIIASHLLKVFFRRIIKENISNDRFKESFNFF